MYLEWQQFFRKLCRGISLVHVKKKCEKNRMDNMNAQGGEGKG